MKHLVIQIPDKQEWLMHVKLISHSHDPALQAVENLTGSPNTASPGESQFCTKPDIIDRKIK